MPSHTVSERRKSRRPMKKGAKRGGKGKSFGGKKASPFTKKR